MNDKRREKILSYLITLRDWENIRGIRQDYLNGKLKPLEELDEVDSYLMKKDVIHLCI
ncbi:hypothetical protein ABE073_04600 [Lederbergia citrisecunda]|uniref:hypothetical protein n=1 Tax=Lederbergia citrisecunda TaxID=2833583 RepID=UPI003D2B5AC2